MYLYLDGCGKGILVHHTPHGKPAREVVAAMPIANPVEPQRNLQGSGIELNLRARGGGANWSWTIRGGSYSPVDRSWVIQNFCPFLAK
jgi:hypothetical protein